MATETFTTPGSGNYQVPGGVWRFTVIQALGSGAAGGEGGGSGGAGGGGGGAGALREYKSCTPFSVSGVNCAYSVGAGGVGVNGFGTGNGGDTSSFTLNPGSVVTSASGGSGGTQDSDGPGNGGSSTVGDTTVNGGNGGSGGTGGGGGGGGCAGGTGSDGGELTGGAGGSAGSYTDCGAGGAGGDLAANGANGSTAGAGGGGAGLGGTHGDGADGEVRLEYLDPATHLSFNQQPTNAAPAATISPAITVHALDAGNNLNTDYVGDITIAIANNPSAGTLSGTLTKTAIAGIATFSDLSINNAGSGYTLRVVSNDSMTTDTSSSFNITGGGSVGAPYYYRHLAGGPC